MNELLKEINERRAYRALSDQPVSDEIIGRIMTAATYAPSCFNSQPWRFMVVNAPEMLAKAHAALSGGNYWAKKAPLLVVVATQLTFDARLSDGRDYALFGCGLAVENLLLQAFAEGLYAHPMAGYEPEVLKQAFSIPEDYIVINLIAIGYPGSQDHLSDKHVQAESAPRNRKPQQDVICFNTWQLE